MSIYSQNIPPSLRGAIEWLYDYVDQGSTLLDFGCSTGYFGKYLKDTKNCKVYGVEISDDKDEARKVLDGVYSFDLDGDWPDEVYERKYDYLFFGDVLEHLKDPGLVLQKAGKFLKKGGKIFVSVPNVAHISVRLELMGGNFEYEPMGILDKTHLKYFTLRSFSELAKASGYHIQAVDYSANDYGDRVIKKMLSKVGLTPDETFWETANKLEARAFQYKFILLPAQQKQDGSPVMPKIDKPEQIRNAFVDDLQQQVDNLRNHAEEQAKIIQHLTNKIATVESESQNASLPEQPKES